MASQVFRLVESGIKGASVLARNLNDLKGDGKIGDWHPGRWQDGKRQKELEIVFDTDADAIMAKCLLL